MWGGNGQVEGLHPGREYIFRVRAANARGAGPWSEVASAETRAMPPDAPEAPTVTQRAATSAKLKWEPPADNGGNVLQYRCVFLDSMRLERHLQHATHAA